MLAEGTVLGPREIGLLAALGAPRVKARPRPRVVVISTGNELREPGTHLDYDSINDGNSYMLAAAVRAAGAICYRVGAVDDNPRTFQRVLSEQLVRADLVVTSGGISKGDHDVVKQTLSALGTVDFHEVAMQPGKPQGFGRVFDEQTPIITLPGNAVSAYVSFEVFVLPAIRRMMGRTPYRRPMVHAVLAADLQSRPGVRQYVRGIFEVTHRGAKVTPLTGAGSHLVGTLAKANALIIVGEDQTALNLGDTVRTLVLDRPFYVGRDRLTHVDDTGAARMVDVTAKDVTARTATARGRVEVSAEVVGLLRGEGVPKGDALAGRPHRRHHGRQADARPDPAVPPDRDRRRRGRPRGRRRCRADPAPPSAPPTAPASRWRP